MKKEKVIAVSIVIIAIVFALLVALIFTDNNSVEKKAIQKQDTSDCIEAYVMSQQYIEKLLKSPSTAKFGVGSHNYECTEFENNKFMINSHVDSQNSFGAMIRSEYTINIKYLGEDKWHLVTLIFDDEIIYLNKKE